MDNHIMIDLETLGTGKDSVILSIGAVQFDPITGDVTSELYRTINPECFPPESFSIDASTVMWWMKQSDGAREALLLSVGLMLTPWVMAICGVFNG